MGPTSCVCGGMKHISAEIVRSGIITNVGCKTAFLLFLKEKMAALEIQSNQLGMQAAKDCERTAKDRTLALQMLHKVSAIY